MTSRQKALCIFAHKLTLTPSAMSSQDIQELQNQGLSDTDILDAVEVISFFNYINRIADALGVDPESWMIKK